MERYGYFIIDMDLDKAWERNLVFWKERKLRLDSQAISVNGLYREFKVKKGLSLKFYGFSSRDNYYIRIAYNPLKKFTYVAVKVTISNIGRGFFWKISQDTMNEWADAINANRITLESKKNMEIDAILDEIMNLPIKEENGQEVIYCSYCGNRNHYMSKICLECGSSLEIVRHA
nr:hypothetical protein [Candidatus Sigynarchaeota archaeon]